jgi:hypothetical protein
MAGLIFVFVVLQHYIWDEDEQLREITERKHINVKVDLRLETACAIALLFGLAAMGFSELDRTFGVFTSIKGSPWWFPFRAIFYVWGEVPEGVPVVDATSLLHNGNLLTGASYNAPLLKWATFWLRIVYEIFVVTALFQLVVVAVRLAEKGRLGEIDRGLRHGDPRRQNWAMTELTRLALRGQDKFIKYLADMLATSVFPPNLRLKAADTLGDVAERWGGIGRLYEAANGYALLLTEWTEKDMPADWAMTQNNLGTALRVLGERLGGEEGAKRLAEAVAAYEAALRVYTEKDMPAQWAATQNNLGIALRVLGERLGGEEGIAKLGAAVEAHEAALRAYTRIGDEEGAADAKKQLQKAKAGLDKLRHSGS